jgi:hypothetical protein
VYQYETNTLLMRRANKPAQSICKVCGAILWIAKLRLHERACFSFTGAIAMNNTKRIATEAATYAEQAAWAQQIEQTLQQLQRRGDLLPARGGDPVDGGWLLIEQALSLSASTLAAIHAQSALR